MQSGNVVKLKEMSGDDIRNIANIVGTDNAYRHFVHRINKEFEIADEERNTHVYVFYQKDEQENKVGFAVVGHSQAKMKVWEETFKEEGWVKDDFRMDNPCFELMYMYIRPEVRMKGFGSRLFDEVVSFTKGEKVRAIYAYVGEKLPAAIKFYKEKGASVIKDLSGDGVSNAFLEWKLL